MENICLFTNFSIMDISYFGQDLLDALGHIHVSKVSPLVSSGDTS